LSQLGRKVLSEPLIDVVLPVFNGARTVRAAIQSLQAQTLRNIRILTVDDGSTDDTPHLLAEMAAGDSRLQIIRQPNGGIVAALNAGLAHCRAEFVARQDADDLSCPRRFEHQLGYMRDHPECLAISGAARHIDEHGRFLGAVARLPSPDTADPNWLPAREPYLMHPFLVARLSAVRAVGGYRYVVHSEDSDLYWRLQEHGRLHNMDAVLGEYRMHDASISGSSVRNGRTMALSSQLGAISALRRRTGKIDLTFASEAVIRYREAASLAEIFKLGCRGLTQSEIEHLEIALPAKLLELADYRPYELELADCWFIRTALAKRMHTARATNKDQLKRLTLRAAARLLHKGLLKEASAILPTSHYPRAAVGLAKRFASGRFNLKVNPWF
jgi:glycosyltransferase involved in cell wall biosynthesis